MSLLFLATVAIAGCTASANHSAVGGGGAALSNDGTRVEVAVLQVTEAELALSLTGEVEGWRDANLASALGGYVEAVNVEGGDMVQKGQVLVSVDRQLYAAGYAQAEAQRDLARSEHARLVKLGDAVSPSQLDQAATQEKVAQAALAQASVRLRRASVSAPFDGVVSGVAVSEGEVAGPGTPVVRLVQLNPAKVIAAVSDRDVAALESGMSVRVTAPAIGQQLTGTVRQISPVGDGKTRAFEAEIEVPNGDNSLLPGMVARVSTQRSLGQAIVVSQDWIISRPESHGVFIEDDGVARWREVELGRVLRNQVLVTSGLAEGDRVIYVGHRDLLDGDAVLVARQGVCCERGRVVHAGEGAPR
jgi:membrane fusion protein (multidrug efflux system)